MCHLEAEGPYGNSQPPRGVDRVGSIDPVLRKGDRSLRLTPGSGKPRWKGAPGFPPCLPPHICLGLGPASPGCLAGVASPRVLGVGSAWRCHRGWALTPEPRVSGHRGLEQGNEACGRLRLGSQRPGGWHAPNSKAFQDLVHWLACGAEAARVHDLPAVPDLRDSGLDPSPGIFRGSP